MDPDVKKGVLGWLAIGTMLALCRGLPLVLVAGIALGSAGYFVGGILLAILGGLAGTLIAIGYLARRARRRNPRQGEDVDPDLLLRIETLREGERRYPMASTRQLRLRITGMTCGDCADTIKAHLLREAGVKDVQIDLASGSGLVAFDPLRTSEERIIRSRIFTSQYRAQVVG